MSADLSPRGAERAGDAGRCLEDLPDLLTVAEAAAYLRVGRNTAYRLCQQWRLSGGREGLGCITVGRSLRVPKVALGRFSTVLPVAPSVPATTVAFGLGDRQGMGRATRTTKTAGR